VVVENIAGSLDYVRDVVPLFEIDGCFEVQGEQEAVLMHPCLPFGYGVACIKMTLKVGFETLDGLADFLVGLLLSVRCVSNRWLGIQPSLRREYGHGRRLSICWISCTRPGDT
jgi:hypothetical protein